MILTKVIKNSNDVWTNDRKETSGSTGYARLNEIILITLNLYEKIEGLDKHKLSPYTIMNCIHHFIQETCEIGKQNDASYGQLWNDIDIRDEDEYYDPIWNDEGERYEYHAYNDIEKTTIFSAFYYYCCFNPDYTDLEGLEKFCTNTSENDETRIMIVSTFKREAEKRINDNFLKHKEEILKYGDGKKKVIHYYLPPIESISKHKGILKELNDIDNTKTLKNSNEKKTFNARQAAVFIHYLLEKYDQGRFSQEVKGEIVALLTGKNKENIIDYISDINKTTQNNLTKSGHDKRKLAQKAKKDVSDSIKLIMPALSSYINDN